MDYFPHDCDARNDLKIRKLRALYGNDGYAVYFILLENIYKEKLYEIEVLDGETPLILAEECKVSTDKFNEILNKCLDLGLFDKQLYEGEKVITSNAIKIRTEPVEKERQRKSYSGQNAGNKVVIPGETPGKSAQRKEKERESKEKESKERVNENSQSLSLYVEKITCGKWFIAKETDKLNVFIEMYSYDWVKDAVSEATKKNKYSMNYVEGILKAWTKEGREVNHGSARANNAEGQGKFAGIKPPEPKISGDIDTTDII